MALFAIAIVVLTGLYFSESVTAPEKPPEQVPEISLSILPTKIIQGDPVFVTVNGTSTIMSITFEGKKLGVFSNDNKLSALIGIDLRKIPGHYPLTVTFKDGTIIKKDLTVGEKIIAKAPLGIPEKLGGDTPESEQNLIKTLIEESAVINAVPTAGEKLWDGGFRFPLDGEVTVTDTYGYSRLTGASTIAHKGTDFRASVGTPVYAANSGTVRYTGFLRNYGRTIVIDHGLGLQTVYMHLSEILVKNGDKINKGELIAKSGDTGYVFGPHLHLSVKIDRISVDPMKFMELLGV